MSRVFSYMVDDPHTNFHLGLFSGPFLGPQCSSMFFAKSGPLQLIHSGLFLQRNIRCSETRFHLIKFKWTLFLNLNKHSAMRFFFKTHRWSPHRLTSTAHQWPLSHRSNNIITVHQEQMQKRHSVGTKMPSIDICPLRPAGFSHMKGK